MVSKSPKIKTTKCSFTYRICRSGKISTKHDVYVLIMDSVSSYMAKRSLPKTIKYLEKEMGAVQMEFLNKIGYNSRPNGFALAFGKSIEGGSRALVGLPPLVPDWNGTQICHEHLDNYSYYLFDYEKEGYKTMVSDDGPPIVNHGKCRGFQRREADHQWRPFDLRRKDSNKFKKSFEDSCSERHLEMLDYLEKFMHAYPGTPKVAQTWMTRLAHDTLDDIFHADNHFTNFFQKNRRVINKSFFFILGDHGPTGQNIGRLRMGQYENLNPFLMVVIPAVYRNSSMHAELRNKTHQLMTNFDLHATLMDILKLQPNASFADTGYRDMMPLSKGSSLLRQWRGPRNCRTLPIPSEFCLCQYNKTEVTQAALKHMLGHYFATQFNSYLIKQHLDRSCQMQHYKQTFLITKLENWNSTLYDVAVYLSPSNGLFSAFITGSKAGFEMSSRFIRLDRYGRQGDCLEGNPDKPLCHCIRATTS
ncbi:hypothetical protein Y032_0003g1616 [Ancylostoma ceylanicum]|uniref:Sulfatase N-terminal domain-containing protein n=1 Tax=Ancylostoma ceylanicum TaxID=53326 RepID=A0A016VYV2_9BILA|nr:hypothetical protein Y032_0003g1616 [Ancylostoma ceylanicum]